MLVGAGADIQSVVPEEAPLEEVYLRLLDDGDEVLGMRSKADPQVTVHGEVITRHDQHALDRLRLHDLAFRPVRAGVDRT